MPKPLTKTKNNQKSLKGSTASFFKVSVMVYTTA
jgi:hypothetical protein